MAEQSYGVVVEKYATDFGIWLLFSGAEGHLSALNGQMCDAPLRLGDIVTAKSNGQETRIHRCPPADAVWTNGSRVVVRTILSYVREITIEQGKWNEDATGAGYVILSSHDLGHVAAPVQWYNSEYSDKNECHLLAFAEFRARPYTNALTDERSEYFWTVLDTRISLPAIPSKHETTDDFMEAEEVRKVPALVIKREDNSLYLWSFVLGNRVAIIMSSDMGEWIADIGTWMTVTVCPSSIGDREYHDCAYTVIKHNNETKFPQPEISRYNGIFSMYLDISKNVAPGADGETKLWNEFWGLPIDYDESDADWVKKQKNEFKEVVEIRLLNDYGEARRVSIKMKEPIKIYPRPKISSLDGSRHVFTSTFEDVSKLKKALHEAEIGNTATEGAEPEKKWPEDVSSGRVDSVETSDANNNEKCASEPPAEETKVVSRGWNNKQIPAEKYDAICYNKAINQEKQKHYGSWYDEAITEQKQKEDGTWCDEEIKQEKQKMESTWHNKAINQEKQKNDGTWCDKAIKQEKKKYDGDWYDEAIKLQIQEKDGRPSAFSPSTESRPVSRTNENRPESRTNESTTSWKSGTGSQSSGSKINWRGYGDEADTTDDESQNEEEESRGEQQENKSNQQEKELNAKGEKVWINEGSEKGVWTDDKGWDYDRTAGQSTRGRGVYGRGRGTGYGFSTGRRPTAASGPTGSGWGAPAQRAVPSRTFNAGSHETKRAFIPILQPQQPDTGFDALNFVAPVAIRAFEDKDAERKWKAEMKKKGWEFPPEPEPIVIPDGEDGWDQCGQAYETYIPKAPAMPNAALIKKRTIVRDAMRLKTLQCLITRVRFDFDWKYADRIQLYVLDGTPAYVVHSMDDKSYLRGRKEFTTVGNVVEVHIGRGITGYYVYDEAWKMVTRLKMPMREAVFEDGRAKTLQIIADAKCLSPEAQDRHNDRWRYNQQGFTMLTDDILHNITYYGKNIDAREHELYNFQVVIIPEERLMAHAFWDATEVLMRVKKELPAQFGPVLPLPPMMTVTNFPPLKKRPPVDVEFKPSRNTYDLYYQSKVDWPVTYPRETRLAELLSLYGKLLENEALLETLKTRTGTDYKKKFENAIEVLQSSAPHQKSMKRELQVNADFLISITENAYAEGIFKDLDEKRLWKLVVKTADSVKAFRSTVNNR